MRTSIIASLVAALAVQAVSSAPTQANGNIRDFYDGNQLAFSPEQADADASKLYERKTEKEAQDFYDGNQLAFSPEQADADASKLYERKAEKEAQDFYDGNQLAFSPEQADADASKLY